MIPARVVHERERVRNLSSAGRDRVVRLRRASDPRRRWYDGSEHEADRRHLRTDTPAGEPAMDGTNAFPGRSLLRGEMVTDPVCGTDVDPTDTEVQSERDGEMYYFCSIDCREEFVENTSEYLD